jgi:transporter, major facilitator family
MAIAAGIFGGILGKFINNGVIYIFGEQFYTIRFAFVIGFILRLFSLLELTRVYSFEKTFVYAGGSGSMKKYVLKNNVFRIEICS